MKIFLAHSMSDRDLVDTVTAQLRADGHEAIRPDEMAAPAELLSEISAALRSSDVVVAFVTGGNPNVFYELGLAAGASVPTLVAARRGESLPVDLASIPYIQLTGDPLQDARSVSRRVKELEGLASPKAVESSSAEAALWAASEDPAILEAIAPSEFERLVADFFRERGYELAETPSTRDAGVDLVLCAPEDGQILLVEVKKLSRQSRVSVESVRQLLRAASTATGAMAVMVSTSGFTAAAEALAAGAPIALRTLKELLAAKTKGDLIGANQNGA